MSHHDHHDSRVRRAIRVGDPDYSTDEQLIGHVQARSVGWADCLAEIQRRYGSAITHRLKARPVLLSYEEARSMLRAEVFEAVELYDPSRAAFSTFLSRRLRWRLSKEANALTIGVDIPAKTMERYRALEEACAFDFSKMTERCTEFALSHSTFVAIYQWTNNVAPLDADGGWDDFDYTERNDNGTARDRLEFSRPLYWTSDQAGTLWEVMDDLVESGEMTHKEYMAVTCWGRSGNAAYVANVFGISPSTAYRRVQSGLEKIQKKMRPDDTI